MKKLKNNWLYMHTIDGCPAYYVKGMQICYANGIRGNSGVHSLCHSVDEIKKEQKLSNKWREKLGYPQNSNLSYIRISRKAI